VWPFSESYNSRLQALETRVQAVEATEVERQLAVLSACEKVLNQLRARVRQRERDAEDAEGKNDGGARPAPQFPGSRRGF